MGICKTVVKGQKVYRVSSQVNGVRKFRDFAITGNKVKDANTYQKAERLAKSWDKEKVIGRKHKQLTNFENKRGILKGIYTDCYFDINGTPRHRITAWVCIGTDSHYIYGKDVTERISFETAFNGAIKALKKERKRLVEVELKETWTKKLDDSFKEAIEPTKIELSSFYKKHCRKNKLSMNLV